MKKTSTENNKKQTLKKVISWTLTIIVLLLMGWYLKNNRHIFSNLKRIKTFEIILIALLQPINIIIGAVINKLIIDSIDQKISLVDSLLLQFANNFLNRFISEGGAVYRGAYLKTQYAFPVSKFLASIGGVYVISLMTNAIIGMIFSGAIYLVSGSYNIYLLIVFLALFTATLLLLLIRPQFKSEFWLIKKVNQVMVGWDKIKSNKPLVGKIFLLSLLALINASLIVFIAYRGLGTEIQLLNSFYYSSISAIVNVINLTPGGLGINEAILMFSSDVIGVTSEIVLLGALLLRAISMLTTLTIGGASYLILNYRLQKATVDE